MCNMSMLNWQLIQAFLFSQAASDESSIAACPLTHQVRMLCKLKNIEPLIMPFNIQKKSKKFLEINSTGKVPVLVHQVNEDEALVLDDPPLIAKYLEELYPDPPIRSKSKEAIVAGSDIFQKFCALIKNQDPSKEAGMKAALLRKMEALDSLLKSIGDGRLLAHGPLSRKYGTQICNR